MNPPKPPAKLRHGNVVRYAVLGDKNALTGNTTRMVDGKALVKPSALAIIHFEMSQGGVYLLYLDDSWKEVANNWHYSIQDAMERAEYEFTNVEWKYP